MPRSLPFPPADRTPQARLAEAGVHGVLGYQLAQASIVTQEVFAEDQGGKVSCTEKERAMGFEPTTTTLATLCSTN